MLKTIGLIGGMSWESTAHYYEALNRGVREALGGLHSAKIILNSLDFAPIEALQAQGNWESLAQILAEAGQRVEAAGAEMLMICTNTMHKVADQVQEAVHIPLIHIADATAAVLVGNSVRTVGLLGTAYTMEQDFYKQRLIENHGLDVVIPEKDDRTRVHDIIYDELCLGQIKPDSRKVYQEIADRLVSKGAQGIILGCTEIGMLLKPSDTDIPLYDTTLIHAQAAVDRACSPESQS